MDIILKSDIHQEFTNYPLLTNFQHGEEPESLVHILAGDICSDPLQLWYLKTENKIPENTPVLHVLGNHEFYGQNFLTAVDKYKKEMADYGITTLNRDVFIYGGVRFLGCTLWTELLDGVGHPQFNYCMRNMADFEVIKNLTVDRWLKEHRENVAWLKLMLAEPFEGKTVVITHHTPSFKSEPEYFRGGPLSAGFHSNLDYVIEEYQPALWVHGHTHNSMDYKIGETRVVCNPFGYVGHSLNREFNHDLHLYI